MPVEHTITGANDTVVEARFQIAKLELHPYYSGHYDENKKWVHDPMRLAGTVQMNAVKHGTFGDATPSGNLSMMIANTHAFEVFKQAFEEAVKNHKTPVFKVYFTLDENQDTY